MLGRLVVKGSWNDSNSSERIGLTDLLMYLKKWEHVVEKID